MLLISTFVGAGIASGREIYEYFFRFGIVGFSGILIFGIFIYCLFDRLLSYQSNGINSYRELTHRIYGDKDKYVNIAYKISMAITIIAMMSGINSLLTLLDVNMITSIITIIAILISIGIVINGGIKRLTIFNSVLAIIMIIVIIVNSSLSICIADITLSGASFCEGILYAIIFAFGNSLIYIELLLSSNIKKKRLFNIITPIFFVVMLMLIYMSLFGIDNIVLIDMPSLYNASQISGMWYVFYICVIMLSMISTLLSCAYNYTTNIKNAKKYNILLIATIGIIIPFSNVIHYGYFINGIISGIIILTIIFSKKHHTSA